MDIITNDGPPFSEAEDAQVFALSPDFNTEASYKRTTDCYSSSVRMQCPFQIDTALPVDLYEDQAMDHCEEFSLAEASDTESFLEQFSQKGEAFAARSEKGKWRKNQEDRVVASVTTRGGSKIGIFGVFDGHGGSEASHFCANNIIEMVETVSTNLIGQSVTPTQFSSYSQTFSSHLESTFLELDRRFNTDPDMSSQDCGTTALVV